MKYIIILLFLPSYVLASDSWFRGDPSQSFLSQTIEIEGDSWATCASAFDAIAEIQRADGKTNTATAFGNQANGAELAIAMAQVMSFLTSENIDIANGVTSEFQAGFNRAWDVGKLKMENLPVAKTTLIMAHLEMTDKPEVWLNQVFETMNVCLANKDAQQMYVDLWRKMLADGWLASPN